MNDNIFNIKLVDFYKNVDKPIINNICNDKECKNILELSSINNISLLKKSRNNWKIQDKRKILKDIEVLKNKKVKEFKNKLDFKNSKIIDIKESNNKILSELESIDNLKEHIENNSIYDKIKNLTLLGGTVKKEKKDNNITNNNIIKLNLKTFIELEDSDSFIEIFSN